MAIQYERTMSINYGRKMSEDDFKRLSGALAEKGVFLTNSHNGVDTDNFGFIAVTKDNTVYPIMVDDETIMTVDWESDAKLIVNGFKSIHPEIEYAKVTTTTEMNEWATPTGNHLSFTIDLEGTVFNFDNWGLKHIDYDNGEVQMTVRIDNSWAGLELSFHIVWECDKVQRKDIIEQVMVDTPLKDMGKIQKIVESRLKLKKFGFDVEDVEINCHFDAKTESRSECTPDIIKQVREARK
jgi:hypothetical protein